MDPSVLVWMQDEEAETDLGLDSMVYQNENKESDSIRSEMSMEKKEESGWPEILEGKVSHGAEKPIKTAGRAARSERKKEL